MYDKKNKNAGVVICAADDQMMGTQQLTEPNIAIWYTQIYRDRQSLWRNTSREGLL
ncbi:hypothetical protein [Psychrobacter sp.]|uniref:hypothetical protein n=1 Tax=Psychrobacter sp. TaxID=56811 RepID=UPI0026480C7D|nr:hypothetical protein [Psychrobacter sp.]MDN6276154.1 hypothetical protein [Psychrobacter sp.]MDN6308145.1 hypothetical protein [Psychrobacter sp.]